MGSSESTSAFNTALHAPPLEEYTCKLSTPLYRIWNHSYQQESLIEISSLHSDSQQLKNIVDLYWMRHRHHLFVSTLFIEQPQQSGRVRLFYERVFTNLARIKDIPFNDSLQFYYVGLKGFELLFSKFGYFQIKEEMFHLTDKKKVKIWLSHDISKLYPERSPRPGSESDMVKRIIQIIDENSDHNGEEFPIGSILYAQSNTFKSAIAKFRAICRQRKFVIPEKLKCLEYIYEGDLGHLLDEYSGNPHSQPQQQQQQRQQLIKGGQRGQFVTFGRLEEERQQQKERKDSINEYQRHHRKSRGGVNIVNKNGQFANNIRNQSRSSSLEQKPPLRTNKLQILKHIESPIKDLKNSNFYLPQPHFIPHSHPHPHHQYHPHPHPYPPHRHTIRHTEGPQSRLNNKNVTFHHRSLQRPSSAHFSSEGSNSNSQYRIIVKQPSQPSINQNKTFSPIPQSQQNSISNHIVMTNQRNLLQPNHRFPPFTPANEQKQMPPRMPLRNYEQRQNQLSNIKVITPTSTSTSTSTKMVSNKGKTQLNFFPVQRKVEGSSEKENRVQERKSFDEFKKNFKYQKQEIKSSNGNGVILSKPQFWKKINEIEEKNVQDANLLSPNTQKNGGFFKKGKLYGQNTVLSHEDDNQSEENPTRRNIQAQNSPIFPSVTDISDNNSYLHRDPFPKADRDDESVVTKHDPNQSLIKFPTPKQYKPEIDNDIWQDVMDLRKRMQVGSKI